MSTDTHYLYADFSIERQTNGLREFVVVLEVKCFTHPEEDLSEFYTAVGQYVLYRSALLNNQLPYGLYLAIPSQAYERFLSDSALKMTLIDAKINLVIVDIDTEEIVEWIPSLKP